MAGSAAAGPGEDSGVGVAHAGSGEKEAWGYLGGYSMNHRLQALSFQKHLGGVMIYRHEIGKIMNMF